MKNKSRKNKKGIVKIIALKRFKQIGARTKQVALRGYVPSICYGNDVLAISSGDAKRLRRKINSVLPSRAAGRSQHLRIAAHRADPLPRLGANTICAWASAVWEGVIHRQDILLPAWSQAASAYATGTLHWHSLSGPAESTFLSTIQIGWLMISPFAWRLPTSTIVDAREVPPLDIREQAEADCRSK